jgi:hypothetical protein
LFSKFQYAKFHDFASATSGVSHVHQITFLGILRQIYSTKKSAPIDRY